MNQKICIVGMGYVGLANALLLAKKNFVMLVDTNQKKVNDFNSGVIPSSEKFSISYMKDEKLNISATTNLSEASLNAKFFVLALPTNLNEETQQYDTEVLDSTINTILSKNKNAVIIIKSTVNIGYTEKSRHKHQTQNIIFSPEFLREGFALYDNLYPSRIVIGDSSSFAVQFVSLIKACTKNSPEILFVSSSAAESIKLFSNAFLAMRVSFFNELDSFCYENNISSEEVIKGTSLDPRIGSHYNNPSFGYGGYCLPKDSKQLLASFKKSKVPNKIFQAIVDSNIERKNFLVSKLTENHYDVIGIYSLAMKEGADNFRSSAIIEIINDLIDLGLNIIIFDPSIAETSVFGCQVFKDFDDFVKVSNIILANRTCPELDPFKDKVFTRDLFNSDI